LRKHLGAKDDFRLDEFLAHCKIAQTRLPSAEEELGRMAEECKKRQAARVAAMSSWERLDVDWEEFHPDARMILDDPFFWDCANEFSPHGNDTGADLLADYRRWLRRNPSGDPMAFLNNLTRQWGFPAGPLSDQHRSVMEEAAVALAFAELKLRAVCPPAIIAMARAALQRQRQEVFNALDWPHRDEKLKSLALLEAKLLTGTVPV
jgi:uncharacterized protein YfeS